MKYKYILLDIDGTLIDFDASFKAAAKKILEADMTPATNENIDMQDYIEWKRENGLYLEKFIKEYLSEHLSVSAFYDGDEMGASLLIDGNEISYGSDRIGHSGYEE